MSSFRRALVCVVSAIIAIGFSASAAQASSASPAPAAAAQFVSCADDPWHIGCPAAATTLGDDPWH